jgi:hypothetical protein
MRRSKMHLGTIRAVAVGCLLVQFAVAPVAQAGESATPTGDEITSQTIAGGHFPNAAAMPMFVALARYILPPGTSITSGTTSGPRLIYVESGTLSIQSSTDHRGFRQAADAPRWAASSSGAMIDAVLPAGAHYQPVLADTAFAFANEGTRAATFLDAIVFPTAPTGIVPYTTMDGVVVDPLVVAIGVTVPATLLDLEIARVELSTNAEMPLTDSAGPRLFVIESGTLEIANESGSISYSGAAGLNPGSQPGRSRAIDPGSQTIVRARGSIVVEEGAVGRISNHGRGRLVLLGLFVKSGP